MPGENFDYAINNIIDDVKVGDSTHLEQAMSEINQQMRRNPQEANEFARQLMSKATEEHVVADIVRTAFSRRELESTLDLDGNGSVSPQEIDRVQATPHLQQRLTPIQQATLGYLEDHSGGKPITEQTLVDLAKQDRFVVAADRYSPHTFVERADLRGPGGEPQDGRLSDAELKAEIARTDEKLKSSEPGELSPDMKRKYEDRKAIAEFMDARPERPVRPLDIFDTAREIRFGSADPNSIHVSPIGFRPSAVRGSVDLGRHGYVSDLLRDYLTDDAGERFKKMDVDSNERISRHEIDMLYSSDASTTRERDLSTEMSTRLPRDFTLGDVYDFADQQAEKRERGQSASEASDYLEFDNHSLDIDHNGTVSKADLDKVREMGHERLATADSIPEAERKDIEKRMKVADLAAELMKERKVDQIEPKEIQEMLRWRTVDGKGASAYWDEDWRHLSPEEIPKYEQQKALEAEQKVLEAEQARENAAKKERIDGEVAEYKAARDDSTQNKKPLVVIVGDQSREDLQSLRAALQSAPGEPKPNIVSLNPDSAAQISPSYKTWLGPSMSGAIVFRPSEANGGTVSLSAQLRGCPKPEEVTKALTAKK